MKGFSFNGRVLTDPCLLVSLDNIAEPTTGSVTMHKVGSETFCTDVYEITHEAYVMSDMKDYADEFVVVRVLDPEVWRRLVHCSPQSIKNFNKWKEEGKLIVLKDADDSHLQIVE